ncbi:MAG TPA: hypothetical protein VFN60_11685 [Acidimicrobiales bacterium]|nr:hypothetical protein [Acidimicrobiales bacterium]
MAMRDDCKYFQRRAYASGESAQFCALGLAPEAPWRCPDDCPRYARRPDLPGSGPGGGVEVRVEPDLHPDAVAVLSSAEEIIGAVGPEIAAERKREQEEERRRSNTWWGRLKGRSPRWRR